MSRYYAGTRVELVSTTDPYTALRPGERGTVTAVDDLGTVHVAWDNGSTLGAVPGEDRIRPFGTTHRGCGRRHRPFTPCPTTEVDA